MLLLLLRLLLPLTFASRSQSANYLLLVLKSLWKFHSTFLLLWQLSCPSLQQVLSVCLCVCGCLCVQLTGSSRTLFESGRRAHSEGNCDLSRRADSTWLKANAKRTRNTEKRLTELTLFLLLLLLCFFSRGLPNFKANPKLFAWLSQAENREKTKKGKNEKKCKLRCCRCQMAAKGSQKMPKNTKNIYFNYV